MNKLQNGYDNSFFFQKKKNATVKGYQECNI